MRVEPARLRRIVIGVVALAAALTTAACTQGKLAQTAREVPAIDGVNGAVGSIDLRYVAIAAPTSGPSYPAGSGAQLSLVLVNTSTADDNLISISSPAAASVTLYGSGADASSALSATPSDTTGASVSSSSEAPSSPAGSSPAGSGAATSPAASSSAPGVSAAPLPLAIPAGSRVSIGITGTDKSFVVTGLFKPLFPGTQIPITFVFQNAGSVTLVVPVQLTTGNPSRLVIPSLTTTG